MYQPDSKIAEEFISDQEIKDTLAYADANKDNRELIISIIEKAKKLKGLSHREASVLLACEDKELIQKVFDLAIKIKERILRQPDRHVSHHSPPWPTTVSTPAVYCPVSSLQLRT